MCCAQKIQRRMQPAKGIKRGMSGTFVCIAGFFCLFACGGHVRCKRVPGVELSGDLYIYFACQHILRVLLEKRKIPTWGVSGKGFAGKNKKNAEM